MKRRLLASVLALVMILGVMIVPSIATAEPEYGFLPTIDGQANEWALFQTAESFDGEAINSTIQYGTNKYDVTAEYDYSVYVAGEYVYFFVRLYDRAIAPVGADPSQTNCTNIRFWWDADVGTAGKFTNLMDFGFNGETVVNSRGSSADIPFEAKVTNDSFYTVEVKIKKSDLGITGDSFGYAFSVSSPEMGKSGLVGSFGADQSIVVNLPTYVLEPNKTYTLEAEAAFSNLAHASGSAFVNYYYGEAWDDIFAVTADAEMATGSLQFTTGETIPEDIRFDSTIGTWGGDAADITVKSLKIKDGDTVVYEVPLADYDSELVDLEPLAFEYAVLHSIVYTAGNEPWTNDSAFSIYSPVQAFGEDLIFDAKKLPLLSDGATAADATAFSDARLMAFQNDKFIHGQEEAVDNTIVLVRNLGSIQPVIGASLTAFIDSASMIDTPAKVVFYGSVDGVSWINLNAGGNGNIPEAEQNKELTVTLDYSDRAVYDLQFIRADVTIDNGWLFTSEFAPLIATDEAQTSVSVNPHGPFRYNLPADEKVGITIFGQQDQPEGGFDLSQHPFKDAQIVKAKGSAFDGRFYITYNKVNPWPDGHTGIMTLESDEIIVCITTEGKLYNSEGNFDPNAVGKWTLRGLTADGEDDGEGSGDFLTIDFDKVYFFPAAAETPDPVAGTKLYVNAINDVVNYSVAGQFSNLNTITGTEGYAAIISDPSLLATSYAWVNIAYFAPTVKAGFYEVVATQLIGGEAAAPLDFPEGGFVYIANTGNDWPTLVANNPGVYDAYADYPNFQTPEVNSSFNAIAGLELGMRAVLYNTNLDLSTITNNFGSFISVEGFNDSYGFFYTPYEYDVPDYEGSEYAYVKIDNYINFQAPGESWPDPGDALIDDIAPNPGEAIGPGYSGAYEYAFDFYFEEPSDFIGISMYFTQLSSWGISIPEQVQVYAIYGDEETIFDVQFLGTAFNQYHLDPDFDGTIEDGNVAFLLEEGSIVKNAIGVRVVVENTHTGWVFPCEMKVMTLAEIETPDDPDDPVDPDEPNPPTGEFTQIGFIALAVLLAAAAVVVIKKRRA